jgi:hypothetical protein
MVSLVAVNAFAQVLFLAAMIERRHEFGDELQEKQLHSSSFHCWNCSSSPFDQSKIFQMGFSYPLLAQYL